MPLVWRSAAAQTFIGGRITKVDDFWRAAEISGGIVDLIKEWQLWDVAGTDWNFRSTGFGPSAGAGPNKIVAMKRPVAVCGKLKQKPMEPRRIARSAQMPLDRAVPYIRRLRHS